MSNKHIRWDAGETVERIRNEFECGITDLDDLEARIRDQFAAIETLKVAS